MFFSIVYSVNDLAETLMMIRDGELIFFSCLEEQNEPGIVGFSFKCPSELTNGSEAGVLIGVDCWPCEEDCICFVLASAQYTPDGSLGGGAGLICQSSKGIMGNCQSLITLLCFQWEA